MLIKHNQLSFNPPPKLQAFYCVLAPDGYQYDSYGQAIIQAWKKAHPDSELSTIDIQTAADWQMIKQKVMSYSLFSQYQLLDLRYEKKTLDVEGKAFITRYLQDPNPDCLCLLRSTELTAKSLGKLADASNMQILQISLPNAITIKKWLTQQLAYYFTSFAQELPELIYQYTENNLLACSQLILKLSLIHPIKPAIYHLSIMDVQQHLEQQGQYSLYDLGPACLNNQPERALTLLQFAANTRIEPTLVLWTLTQEIRTLSQLMTEIEKKQSLTAAGQKLGIWSNKIPNYHHALQRLSKIQVNEMLLRCAALDKQIKSHHHSDIWQAFERLALTLCRGGILCPTH